MIKMPLKTIESVRQFMFGGNATMTIKSMKSGTRFTYKVERPDDHDKKSMFRFVSVLTGSNNEGDYTYLGHFGRNGYVHGIKSPISQDAPSAVAMRYLARCLEENRLSKLLEVWHEGRCGPTCAKKLGIACVEIDPELEMQLWEAIGDREGTERDERNKHEARAAMEA
jgi:hypothetical protein